MGATQASALIAIAQNDDVRAHQVLKELEPQSGTWSPGYPMSIDRLLGQLYVVVGDRIKAISHFENALEFGRNGKLLQKLVWTCSDYAEMLLDNDDASPSGEGLTDASASGISDHEKAITLQDEALVITQELGMRPLTERILARREILRG
jgi:tetratricopeptide (TPR) repeat protein